MKANHQLSNDKDDEQQPLSLWQVAVSVLAAAFGVQSKANKVRDFTRGSAKQFIIVGIILTLVLLLTVVTLVQFILSNTQ